jgi:hypothetical protein
LKLKEGTAMAITLNLPPELEAKFAARARALGVELETYIQRVLENQTPALAAPQGQGGASRPARVEVSELEWLALNRAKYAGRWVALQGDALLAVGDSAREVYSAIAGREGVPLVTRVDSEEESPFAGW